MENELEICEHINLLDEAYRLLYYWVNIDGLEAKRIEFIENYKSDYDRYNKRFDAIIEMYHYITEHLQTDKEQIDYYFKERNAKMSTLGALATMFNYYKYDNELRSHKEYFRTITGEAKIWLYAMIINSDEAVNTSKEKLSTLSDLIAFVEASPYENDAKWEVIKIFSNQEFHYNEVYRILSQVIEIFNDKFSDQIKEMGQEFYEYWNEYQKVDDIIALIGDKLHVSWNYNKAGTVVLPQLFDPLGISISIDETDRSSKDVIRLGVILDKHISIRRNSIKKIDIINFGKLLSDKSKVDILEYISKKPAYGKEIANEMNLSTATISYHVNALLKYGFIREEITSNRIYYSINKEKIYSHLDEMKNFFVEL